MMGTCGMNYRRKKNKQREYINVRLLVFPLTFFSAHEGTQKWLIKLKDFKVSFYELPNNNKNLAKISWQREHLSFKCRDDRFFNHNSLN